MRGSDFACAKTGLLGQNEADFASAVVDIAETDGLT